ncbi:MAG: hypothetical protein JOZ91_08670 [Candidatus Eremiobacteraeota bacterium]|nr:hypothetical protein [Candidatus Eremiobacteraeota bacterium]MBV8263847.1 hypothetical protein [Candidatus Eremiobacteraeota bacterium]MBV8338902.1 hypothetical protein [Candidatus Eremiobacteraeota bacterium]
MRWLSLCVAAIATASMLWTTACTSSTTIKTVCPQTLSFPVALIYPAASATNVPVNAGTILVQGGFTGRDVSVVVMSLSPPSSLVVQAPLGPPPTPLPTPLSTPAILARYPLASIAMPQLVVNTEYSVVMVENFAASPVCPAISQPLGGFITQP